MIKRILLTLLIATMLTIPAQADKDYTFSRVGNLTITIHPNYFDGDNYNKIHVVVTGIALTSGDDGLVVPFRQMESFGGSQPSPYTDKEIYQFLNSIHTKFGTLVKNAYLNAINEDVSQ